MRLLSLAIDLHYATRQSAVRAVVLHQMCQSPQVGSGPVDLSRSCWSCCPEVSVLSWSMRYCVPGGTIIVIDPPLHPMLKILQDGQHSGTRASIPAVPQIWEPPPARVPTQLY